MNPAIVVNDLTRTYGELVAVDGVSFEVSPGEIVGLIGPNGAGKTTLLECLEGLRTPSGGSVRVLDVDPAHPTPAWRTRIGVQLQTAALPPKIKVREAMSLFASLYDHPADADELLEELGIGVRGLELSHIAPGLLLEQAFQQTRLLVDEAGAVAAALTEAAVMRAAAHPAPRRTKRFVCDRPFVLRIVDLDSGAAVFEDAVLDPARRGAR